MVVAGTRIQHSFRSNKTLRESLNIRHQSIDVQVKKHFSLIDYLD